MEICQKMMFVLLLLVASLQWTVSRAVNPQNHPNRRHARQVSLQAQNIKHVDVSPLSSNFYQKEKIHITCTVDAGHSPNNHPFISFYRQVSSDTTMRMSGVVPGVYINAPTYQVLSPTVQRSSTTMTLSGPQVYPFLDTGRNVFYCKAELLNGTVKRKKFRVYKFPVKR